MTPSTKDGYALVYITAPNVEAAATIARTLVDETLIACANVFPAIQSVYKWNDEVVTDSESVIIAKSITHKVDALRQRVLELHPYDTPCVIAIDLNQELSSTPFLDWISQTLR